jgi:hypothetical protein
MPADSDDMDVPRLSLGFSAAAIIALVAIVWLIDFDESADAERRLQRAATSESNPEPAQVGRSDDPGTSGEAGWRGSGAEASHARPRQDAPRSASVPSLDTATGTLSGGAREAGRVPAMTASEIEQRWRSRDPEDRAVAIDGLNALSDRMLAIDVVQQMITRERPDWNDPAWDALDVLDPELKVDAVAEMLFASEPDRSAAIRLLAGDRWQHAQQMLSELLGTTNANFEDHGDLIANGVRSVGEGATAAPVLRSLKQEIAAFD